MVNLLVFSDRLSKSIRNSLVSMKELMEQSQSKSKTQFVNYILLRCQIGFWEKAGHMSSGLSLGLTIALILPTPAYNVARKLTIMPFKLLVRLFL